MVVCARTQETRQFADGLVRVSVFLQLCQGFHFGQPFRQVQFGEAMLFWNGIEKVFNLADPDAFEHLLLFFIRMRNEH